MRVVIDTNDFISALIGKKHRQKLEKIILNESIEILADSILLAEIEEVASREKFKKYISKIQIDAFVALLKLRVTIIVPYTIMSESPDPDDNFLLAIAYDGQADYLITGDKSDLLSLGSIKNIPIIRLDDFLILMDTSV